LGSLVLRSGAGHLRRVISFNYPIDHRKFTK
jgi:hypothetical protein